MQIELYQSWLNMEVESLEVIFPLIVGDIDKIYAPFLKKLIINKKIDWNKHIDVSDSCEIVLI